MKVKLVKIHRGLEGINNTPEDSKRLNKLYYVEGFLPNMVARFYDLENEGYVLITSPVKSVNKDQDILSVKTANSQYWFDIVEDDENVETIKMA